jgi:3-oxoacyl-[acyl-carrier protein] reductase
MAPTDRLAQLSSHLNYPRGLLANQLAIITGSGQGIGAETARLFANEGARVIISDIDAEKAAAVANAINNSGCSGAALAVPGDMLDDGYIQTLVQKAAEFGKGEIHIIVNNAGFTWDGVIHKVRNLFSLSKLATIIKKQKKNIRMLIETLIDNRQTMGYNHVPARLGPF